ncbi:hypothetical protein, partial [Staphylococcus warneri]|uniref:hypothetical protein n=1 Tax=Staphylococcus warneri TaxID=1292 RepID=UPI001C983F89
MEVLVRFSIGLYGAVTKEGGGSSVVYSGEIGRIGGSGGGSGVKKGVISGIVLLGVGALGIKGVNGVVIVKISAG